MVSDRASNPLTEGRAAWLNNCALLKCCRNTQAVGCLAAADDDSDAKLLLQDISWSPLLTRTWILQCRPSQSSNGGEALLSLFMVAFAPFLQLCFTPVEAHGLAVAM
jgi:hypothetical protein